MKLDIMKTAKITSLLSFGLLLFSSSSCESDDIKNRPEGDDTFLCLIDGNLFMCRSNPNIASALPTIDKLYIYISVTENFSRIVA